MGKYSEILKDAVVEPPVANNPYLKNCCKCLRFFNPIGKERICFSCSLKKWEDRKVNRLTEKEKKRSHRLGRPCKRCGKRFIPTGSSCRVCFKCQEDHYKHRRKKNECSQKNK